ncbi:TPA: hypothetical protein N0F65_003044 [Lagenidium giganteum]|uniref:LIM zinc-binding domain-containing protein n=1 Tax=Lagenidium giganteum TaxID=4803 RepID=A0AAV2YF75_9STRA|nr:TPA: hypothetical protein N0F65_003044 [Lagenidium giganteum]
MTLRSLSVKMAPWSCEACTFQNADDAMTTCEMCATMRTIKCAQCGGEMRVGPRLMAQGKTYHPQCFRCAACHGTFEMQQFQVHEGDPYHTPCFRELFHPMCEVCDHHIPFDATSQRIMFREVPFWKSRYCLTHDDRERCCSCTRLEPLSLAKRFDMLSDGRKVCHDCCMSIVLDTHEAQAAVRDVWQFMASIGIDLPELPVYLVEYSTLNEHQHATHSMGTLMGRTPATTYVTRGVCLSEVSSIQHLVRLGGNAIPQLVQLETNRSVSAILVLHGLPYDLTAQVIAHEATHAYIKLNSSFPTDIPLQVEEGVCQLMSYLWLKYKHVVAETTGSVAPFASRLREFYMQQIENDQSEVYGDGFREALEAYNRTHSLQRVFDSIRSSKQFP